MKTSLKTALSAALSLVLAATAYGWLDDKWNCDVGAFLSHTTTMYHGETVTLKPTVVQSGRLVTFCPRTTASFMWQTNGMDSAWWTATAKLEGSTACIDFTPAMDPGADSVQFFFYIESPKAGNFRVNGTINFRKSPFGDGTTVPWPTKQLDFSTIEVLNAPYYTQEETDLALETLQTNLEAQIATSSPEGMAEKDRVVIVEKDGMVVTNVYPVVYMDDLAQYATTNDVVLSERGENHDGFSAWTILRDGSNVTRQVQQPLYVSAYGGYWNIARSVIDGDTDMDGGVWEVAETALTMGWRAVVGDWGDDPVFANYTATRTALPGYVLGSQTNKVLAAETEVEHLRTNKLDKVDVVPPTLSAENGQASDAKATYDALQMNRWYADGTVNSTSQWTSVWDGTQGLKVAFNTDDFTASVKPFCETDAPDDDNSTLVGRVVIPPFVEKNGARYAVTSIGSPNDYPDITEISAQHALSSVVAPTTVDNMMESAFANCKNLKSVAFSAVTNIGTSAFEGSGLHSISVPSSVHIGGYAFLCCLDLTSVYAPAVTEIGDRAFEGCLKLDSIDFGDAAHSVVPTLGSEAFNNVPTSCKIIVPDAQYDAWVAAPGWSNLRAQGYKFLRHSEWEYARRFEVESKVSAFNGTAHDIVITSDDITPLKVQSTSASHNFFDDEYLTTIKFYTPASEEWESYGEIGLVQSTNGVARILIIAGEHAVFIPNTKSGTLAYDDEVVKMSGDVSNNLTAVTIGNRDTNPIPVLNITPIVGSHSLAQGDKAVAMGDYAHSEGESSYAIGNYAHAEGKSAAVGEHSHSEGNGTLALGDFSHAEGIATLAGTNIVGVSGAHAEGAETMALATASHAEGSKTMATTNALASHAEGIMTVVAAPGSHAEGLGMATPLGHLGTAGGFISHVEGICSTALGLGSHSGGVNAHDNLDQTSPNANAGSFVWQGYRGRLPANEELWFYFAYPTNSLSTNFFAQVLAANSPYVAHGPGTFNVNPRGGADGFYIGHDTLSQLVAFTFANPQLDAASPASAELKDRAMNNFDLTGKNSVVFSLPASRDGKTAREFYVVAICGSTPPSISFNPVVAGITNKLYRTGTAASVAPTAGNNLYHFREVSNNAFLVTRETLAAELTDPD